MLTLLWFSRDLRLSDNPALAAAVARGGPIVPFFLLDDLDAGEWSPGGAARWWLHGSLRALNDSLRQRGNRLVLRHGSAEIVINQLLDETRANAVYWNRRYEPWATIRAERLKATLRDRGIEVRSFNSALIREPWTVATQKGEPYRVFTPFWKALRATGVSEPATPAPPKIPGPDTAP
jgi:deoxyribodipyrimidine photo-lyase